MNERRLMGTLVRLRAAHYTPLRKNAAVHDSKKMRANVADGSNMSRHGSAVGRPVYLQQRTCLVTAAMTVECQPGSSDGQYSNMWSMSPCTAACTDATMADGWMLLPTNFALPIHDHSFGPEDIAKKSAVWKPL
jgi:hypothetical protein